VAAEATGMRFADLFADRVWSRIGAERDAEVIVDAAGFPAAEGGFCTTLRDLARFGLERLEQGAAPGAQPELVAAFSDDAPLEHFPTAFYHDCWWVSDAEAGVYSGYGINGQQLLIHHPARTVIARFSTWPVRWDERLLRSMDAINGALIDRLS
jgi:CubicO group peptidase (beta-lactamase class C family)